MTAAVIAEAHRLLVQGNPGRARQLLEAVADRSPVAAHILAVACRRLDDPEAAERWFAHAASALPQDAEVQNNWGNLRLAVGDHAGAVERLQRALALAPSLLDARYNLGLALLEAQQPDRAAAELEQVIGQQPTRAPAWSALARACRAAGLAGRALEAADRALALHPQAAPARAIRALIAADLGETDAADRLAAIAREQPHDRKLCLAWAEALADREPERADQLLSTTLAEDPGWTEGQAALVSLRYQQTGAQAAFETLEQALDANPGNVGLVAVLASAGGESYPTDKALHRIDAALSAHADHPALTALKAEYLLRAGQPQAARALVEHLPDTRSADAPAIARTRLRCLIATSAIEAADRLCTDLLVAHPTLRHDMGLWALRHTIWRLLDSPKRHWLEQPDLWASHALDFTDTELAETIAAIDALHRRRHHPAAQSLRHGTQTAGPLLDRLDPAIARLKARLLGAAERHREQLPPPIDGHPTLDPAVSTRPWRMAGSWSVRLTGGGHHVPHVHPRGVLSSACHLVVPPGAGSGTLLLGVPPSELATGLGPIQRFEPTPGKLVLFPSWLWHGTEPVDAGKRLTVAFDLIPA
jgi:Tfp pilus assembly protein PilF